MNQVTSLCLNNNNNNHNPNNNNFTVVEQEVTKYRATLYEIILLFSRNTIHARPAVDNDRTLVHPAVFNEL